MPWGEGGRDGSCAHLGCHWPFPEAKGNMALPTAWFQMFGPQTVRCCISIVFSLAACGPFVITALETNTKLFPSFPSSPTFCFLLRISPDLRVPLVPPLRHPTPQVSSLTLCTFNLPSLLTLPPPQHVEVFQSLTWAVSPSLPPLFWTQALLSPLFRDDAS